MDGAAILALVVLGWALFAVIGVSYPPIRTAAL